jgi:competence protein ComEC
VLMTPLALLGVLLPWAWTLATWVTEALFRLLAFMASWPVAVWSLPHAPLVLQGLALLGLVLLVLRLPRLWRGLGLLLLLPLFIYQPERPAMGEFKLRVFDVGQGSALWLQTATHDAVVDAGPRWGPGGGQDAGARVLLPSLRAAGVRRLDLLLLSHGDADHAGGAASLQKALPIDLLRAPVADARLAPLRAQHCHAGLSWDWDGVRFAVLHPPPGPTARSPNAASCVLRVQAANGRSLLVPADLEAPEEALLLQTGAALQADLLLLPHHGSQTSSTAAFLAAVQPRMALAQSGYRSRHGHPALSVQNRLRELGVPLLTSADCGAFDWHSSEAPSRAGCWRQQRVRYWHQLLDASPAGNKLDAGPMPPEAP